MHRWVEQCVDWIEQICEVLEVHVLASNFCLRLERGEFCVDFEERYAIASTTKASGLRPFHPSSGSNRIPSGQERCDALRAEIEHQNVARCHAQLAVGIGVQVD